MMFKFFQNKSVNIIKVARQRIYFVVFVLAFIFIMICVRLFCVMIYERYLLPVNVNIPVSYTRADIVDCNGDLIATSIPTESAYIVTKDVQDKNDAIAKIASIFPDLSIDKLKHKFYSEKKFVWLKRHLTPMQVNKLLSQGITGVYFINTQKRVYPDKNLFAHILGYTDIDNNGLAGIEKKYDERLKTDANVMRLTVDSKIQHAVREELYDNMEYFKAKGAGCAVFEIKTGKVLALCSVPDFDPNLPVNPESRTMFNILTTSAIEPGSNAKIINTALALSEGLSAKQEFDARFPIKIGRFKINDFKGKACFLTMHDVFKYSSNIGSAKIVMEVGAEKQKAFFKKLGLFECYDFDLDLQSPLLPRQWTEVSAITISYGHGIAFCPMHYVASLACIVNDGNFVTPYLVEKEDKNDISLYIKNLEEKAKRKKDSEKINSNFVLKKWKTFFGKSTNNSQINDTLEHLNTPHTKQNASTTTNATTSTNVHTTTTNAINNDNTQTTNMCTDSQKIDSKHAPGNEQSTASGNAQEPQLNNNIQKNTTTEHLCSQQSRIIPKVISDEISKQIRVMMRVNVVEGTNTKAEVKGYLVGGKSGTAEKNVGGRYSKKANYTTFFGVFPMNDPKYVVYVVFDEPQALKETYGYATAGWNAVPSAGAIIQRLVSIFGMKPVETDIVENCK